MHHHYSITERPTYFIVTEAETAANWAVCAESRCPWAGPQRDTLEEADADGEQHAQENGVAP